MAKIAIMTDTNSGFTKQEAELYNIFLVSMPILIDNETYFENVNFSHNDLYNKMKEDKDIFTSQPSAGVLTDMWDEILKEYDNIIYIPMSSGLSGSYATAKGLSAEYEGKVEVVNAHRISFTLKHSIFDAMYFIQQGCSAEEIRIKLEENAFRSVIYLGVDTLKYLKKSGRVTATAATVATILQIKPILFTEGEKFDVFEKTRGLQACKAKIIEAAQKELNGRFSEYATEDLTMATAGSFESPEDAEEWRKLVQETFPQFKIEYNPLSCSIASHTGPGAIGIAISRIYNKEMYQ